MTTAVIALGSNLGERQDWLAFAVDRLSAAPEVRIVKRSGIFETDPVGVPEQFQACKFLNQVLLVETGLDATTFSRLAHQLFARGPKSPLGRWLLSILSTQLPALAFNSASSMT